MMAKNKDIKSDENLRTKNAVIGTYEGECSDATITNLNGLDVTEEVWETVFNSEEYKRAIELGHYIGFLGHPEDSGCQDYKDACIVMKEGHLGDDGKVYGKFDLIDTPVGRVVKSFQDAGVKFGISFRAFGDYPDGHTVEPDTFVFRGFDLVTFPAYPDAIPEFTEIAASTDITARQNYKKVCNTVKKELHSISSSETLDELQHLFSPKSEEFKEIEDRKAELFDTADTPEEVPTDNLEVENELLEDKLDAVTGLLIEVSQENEDLRNHNLDLEETSASIKSSNERKLNHLRRIVAEQNALVKRATSKQQQMLTANAKLKEENSRLTRSNLLYKQRLNASKNTISDLNDEISSLNGKVSETVNASAQYKKRASNLDANISNLQSEVESLKQLLADYQEAYASMYAGALGLHLENLSIQTDTSISELQKLICSTSTSGIGARPYVMRMDEMEEDVPTDEVEDESEDEVLVTL